MSEFQDFPKYESQYNTSQAGTESQVLSELNNYQNPTLLSTEMNYDKNNMIVKPAIYSQPKYMKEKKTYEVLQPITKEVMELPTKRKHKVKTTKTVYNKEIVLGDNDDLTQLLLDNAKFEQQVNAPLPTQSTIQNLCKNSVMQSFHPSFQQSNSNYSKYSKTQNNYIDNQNNYGTKIETKIVTQAFENPQNSQKHSHFSNYSKHSSKLQNPNPNPNPIQFSTQNPKDMNKKYQSTNMKYDYQMSKISKFPSTYTNAGKEKYGTNITNIPNKSGYNNVNNSNQNNLTEPNVSKHSHHSKMHISNQQGNIDGGFVEVTDISKKTSNKNYIETYFHDDDIPKPMVLEGEALEGSDIKGNINNQINIIQPSTNEINKSKHSAQVAKLENSAVSKKSNNLSMKQSSSIHTNKSNMNNVNNNNNISQKSSQQNYNDPNKSVKIKKLYSKNELQSNNALGEMPVDRTEIMSKQPSVNMSQKNSNMFNQSNSQVNQDSKIQTQSKIYQQSKNNSSINQKSSNHQSIKQSNVIEKSNHQSMKQSNYMDKPSNHQSFKQSNVNGNISNHNSKIQNNSNNNPQVQRSNMTYQQPYNPYNQSKQLETPPAYHSQNYNNEYNNNQKQIKESNNIKNSHQSNYKQSNPNNEQSFGNKNSKLQNQSNIYQQSMKQSGNNNNINNMNNNINNSNFNNSFFH